MSRNRKGDPSIKALLSIDSRPSIRCHGRNSTITNMGKLIKRGYDPRKIFGRSCRYLHPEVILRRVARENILEEIERRELE